MKKIIHKSESRGHADHRWLNAHHSFSFASWHNPEKVHFGMLRVLNDDIVKEGKGFGSHPHDNMEIVTIPLKGQLQHKDSMGNSSVINENEVQVMSAGSGVTHSEFNPSDTNPVNLFQIWVFPDKRDVEPRYDQKKFNPEERKNKLQVIVSPRDNIVNGSMWIHQNAYFTLGDFDSGKEFTYEIKGNSNGVYVMVIEGSVEAAGEKLNKRDAIGISETDKIDFKALEDTQLLLIEVPMK